MNKNGNHNGERLKKKLGVRLRELRKEKKMSQLEFAYECNLDKSYIASIEQGKRNVCLINLGKIARACGLTLSEFFQTMNGNHHKNN